MALAETGTRTRAAAIAGVHRSVLYTPQWKEDRAFQAALKAAEEVAADRLEAEAWRRAVEGVERPVGWHKGRPGGTVCEYSDILLIFLLKGLRPEKYRERIELKGGLAHLDLRQLPDSLLERIANGENIMSVLASALPTRADGSVDTKKMLAQVQRGEPAAGAERVEHEDVTAGEGDTRGDGAVFDG